MAIKIDSRQIRVRDALRKITGAADSEVDNILRALEKEVTPPFYLSATQAASLVLNIGTITVVNPETSANKVPSPISGLLPTFASATVTADATGAGNITPSVGSAVALGMIASQFRRFGININSAGSIELTAGTAAGTLAGAGIPASVTGKIGVGHVVIRTDGSNNVQNILDSDIYTYTNPSNNTAATGTANYVAVYDGSGNLTGIGAGAALTLGDISTTLAVPGKIRAGDGTSASPGYSFGLDTDTGMYRNGDNDLRFTTGNFNILSLSSTEVTAHNDLNVTNGITTTFFADVSTGRIGVGTSAPTYFAHFKFASSGGNPAQTSDVVIEGSGGTNLVILGPNTSTVRLNFGDQDDDDVGGIHYSHTTEVMTFRANNAPQFTMAATRSLDVTTAGSTSLFTSLTTGHILTVGGALSVTTFPGQVGIGTSTFDSAGTKLQVTSSDSGVTPDGSGDDLFIENVASGGITIGSGGTNQQGALFFGSSLGAVHGGITYEHVGTGTLNLRAANATRLSATSTGISIPNDLTVDTTTLKVDSTNNRVGIGTASPGEELHILGATSTTTLLIENVGANTGISITAIDAFGIVETTTADPLVFRTGTTEAMRIDASQNVGIGATTITANLHIEKSAVTTLEKSTGTSGIQNILHANGAQRLNWGIDNSAGSGFYTSGGVANGIVFAGETGIQWSGGGTVPQMSLSTGGLLTVKLSGVTDASNAAAGVVGEFIQSANVTGVTAAASNTAFNVTSVSLPAGDWIVTGLGRINKNGATTFIDATVWLSTTSATTPAAGPANRHDYSNVTGLHDLTPSHYTKRFNLSATTTVYFSKSYGYTGTIPLADGYIMARRVR